MTSLHSSIKGIRAERRNFEISTKIKPAFEPQTLIIWFPVKISKGFSIKKIGYCYIQTITDFLNNYAWILDLIINDWFNSCVRNTGNSRKMTEIWSFFMGLYYAPLRPPLIIFDNSSVLLLSIDIAQYIVY